MIKRRYIVIVFIMAVVVLLSILYPFLKKEDNKILVFAAVSLSDPLKEIKDIYYEDENVNIILNFGGSQTLASQISKGATPDIFVPAGISTLNFVKKKNVRFADSYFLLSNELIFASDKQILDWDKKGIEEIIKSEKINRISIADPELAPAGEYTVQAINNMNINEFIQHKIIKAKNVRDAVNHMRLGLSDAVFAYNTDFNNYKGNYNKKFISEKLYNKIQYPIIIFNNHDQVDQFLMFLNSDRAQNIFKKYGFSKP